MKLTGYSSRWSVRSGETIGFHVHSDAPQFEAQIVRLHHGDENPRGPGFKESIVSSPLDGHHPGAPHSVRPGSFGIVDLDPVLELSTFTMMLWIWSTTPRRSRQGIACGRTAAGANSWGLFLSDTGTLEWEINGITVCASQFPIDAREWYFVFATLEAERDARLVICRQRFTNRAPRSSEYAAAIVRSSTGSVPPMASLLFAAGRIEQTQDGPAPHQVFNGKLAAPSLYATALSIAEVQATMSGGTSEGLIAAWDFSKASASSRLIDVGPSKYEGQTWNRPARLMTGPSWNGDIRALQAYDAIHFHDDDVADVGWPESVSLTIPIDWASGVYALRLRADDEEDHLPFFVCPPRGGATSPIAFLIPTLSYLVYSNESLDVRPTVQLAPLQNMEMRPEVYRYIADHGLMSGYDKHSDGSGICYASMRRPILDFRPKARCRTFDAPHQFAADLYLIDWLESKGVKYDVVTDHELHSEGVELLRRYRVILTGSHPEYWTSAMIEARDSYLEGGGRLMYLGGNGFYWVTALAEDDPGLVEVRRWAGIRTWQSLPGEVWLSLTNELGGLWRDRGRAPQKTVGVGFSGMGFDRGVPYRRTSASYAPEFSFIFDGVEGETIGAGQSLVMNYGAVGFEVDRADAALGTPAHAVVLASSFKLTDAYQSAVEEILSPTPWDGGSTNPRIRADMVFLEYPNGGAVFSVGSINWTATLSSDEYENDTSRITENVLRAFGKESWRQVGSAAEVAEAPLPRAG
jgi:N,N-dimethylformamidase